jgi:DNA helicase-2/ATP-dependent DNA helicase PcrA
VTETPNPPLPPEALAIIDEEQQLLTRVLASLEAKRAYSARDPQELLERLKDLREQATKAASFDLPTIFQEMSLVRALLEHPQEVVVPDRHSPYFAHLKLREGDKVTDYCLGRASFFDTLNGVRVVDWRFAPIARIFYRYREGDAYEEQLPGRLAEGTVEARRVVVVHRGELTRILTPDLSLTRTPEGEWLCHQGAAGSALRGGAGSAARAGSLGVGSLTTDRSRQADVSALLDREQFEALNASPDSPLLVLGSAGSGKTTVALHRLASLTFEDPQRFPASRLQVVVPELGLARLSARLLEPLGLGKVSVLTLEDWARQRVHGMFGAPPPRLCEDAPPLVSRLKRHPALYFALRKKLMRAATGSTKLPAIRRELGELFTDRGFLLSVVEAAAGGLPTTAVEQTVRHTMLQLASPLDSLAGVDASRLETLDGRSLDEGTPEELAGTVDVEDLPLFLFVRAYRASLPGGRLAHLVVDEAEDISLFELFVLGKHLGVERSVTLAGDDAQQTFSSLAGWDQALSALGAEGAATCRLSVAYRCPRPVAKIAQRVLGPLAPADPAVAGRDGAPVGRFDFPTEAHANLFLVDALRDLVEREPEASVGVIARGPESAQAFYRALEDLPEARLVLDGAFSFQPGIDVTDVANVKGLEFDYVIVPDASASAYPLDDEARRLLHVAITRASHQLWLIATGTPSPLLT